MPGVARSWPTVAPPFLKQWKRPRYQKDSPHAVGARPEVWGPSGEVQKSACWHAGMLACWHAKSAWGGNHIRVNTTKNNQILRVPVQHYASVFRSWLGTSCHFMQQPFRRRRKHFSKIRHQHAITMKLHASMQHAHFGVDMWFAWHASASACQQPAAASEGGTCKPLKGEFHPGMP